MFAEIKQPKSHRFRLFLSVLLFPSLFAYSQPGPDAVDGTTGAPLGGVGCGGIKYCAHNSTFYFTGMTPCALQNFPTLPSQRFQFFSKRGQEIVTRDTLSSVITGGRSDDDAAYPIHRANFGEFNGVSVRLTAFAPVDYSNVPCMCYPYAFYQISVSNTAPSSIDVAIALQAVTKEAPAYVAGKGIKCDQGALKQALYASSDDKSAIVSVGNDNGFLTNGQCNNAPSGTLNKVVVKVSLAANETKSIKFVYAWHSNANGAEGLPRFYYLKTFSDAGSVADTGLSHFDGFRENALAVITRMRASNVPSWIKNQAIVTLANLTNNTMYTKDERFAFTEGQWSTNGTMDQMWHARQIFIQTAPSLIWQEMKYWASTQKTSPAGQIHHDLGERYNMAYMCPWDDRQHPDYRPIDKWVDLNCAYIISLYELFIATADKEKLTFFWPSIKLAGQRILDMVQTYGSTQYPYTFDGTENSYDAGGDPNPYNGSLAVVTYRLLSILAEIQGETTLKQTYDAAFAASKENFQKRYLTPSTAYPWGRISEAVAAGPCLAYFLKIGDLFDTAATNFLLKKLDTYYQPLSGFGYTSGTYNEWAPYIIGHYAGLALAIGRYAEWKAMQYDWYERIFYNRDRIFNQELGIPSKVVTPKYLSTDSSGYINYLSTPVVWRNYYMLVGFHRNKHTGELWLEPLIPPEMNHQLSNALVFTPEGWATIGCVESGDQFLTQTITFKPDAPMDVRAIYLRDKGSPEVYVRVNKQTIPKDKVSRIGSGYQREVKVAWEGAVSTDGLTVTISNDPIGVISGPHAPTYKSPRFACTARWFQVTTCANMPHDVGVYSINGELVKRTRGFGTTQYRFGARGGAGSIEIPPGLYVVRAVAGNVSRSNYFTVCH